MARMAGISRVEAEAASLGVSLANANRAIVSRMAQDAVRARHYASRYARAWLGSATGKTTAEAIVAADAATSGRLTTIATSEASGAFNEGRLRLIETVDSTHLMRMWDSAMEARSCAECVDADGTIVGARESFPLGEPGTVHPRCLCTWHLLTVDELNVATSTKL